MFITRITIAPPASPPSILFQDPSTPRSRLFSRPSVPLFTRGERSPPAHFWLPDEALSPADTEPTRLLPNITGDGLPPLLLHI